MPSPTQRALALVPQGLRPTVVKHRKLVKFLLVGGTCFLLTLVINLTLKATVLSAKPVAALTIATVTTTVVSYLLNRKWSFRAYGRQREAVLYFVVSALAIVVNNIPLAFSQYVLDLREPHLSAFGEAMADFLSGMIIGTLLAMVFRYWAMARYVFTDRLDTRPVQPSEPERV
ncbi:GtrA family protein [Kitasatospora sp. NPDC096147]|uniref:GtrA family protein n=1 Tax=Kitasatospora sp. NPDC096147 TaxID=3364093 RepID=UPI00382B17D2